MGSASGATLQQLDHWCRNRPVGWETVPTPPSTTPLVDVVIPVHTANRPLARAVESVVRAGLPMTGDSRVRINVVCHNVAAGVIRNSLSAAHQDLVRLSEFRDETRSPAGPRNLGLQRSTGRYVSFLDSDDSLQPGALAHWVRVAEKHGSSFVIPRVSHSSGGTLRSPLPRVFRRGDLDALKDRLIYRTVMFGLLRNDFARALQLSFDESLVTGEDLELGLRIYFSGGRLDAAPAAPGYVLWDDAAERVRTTHRPVLDDMLGCVNVACAPWFRDLDPKRRSPVVVKFLRVHVLGAIATRGQLDRWSWQDRHDLARSAAAILGAAPMAREFLSRTEDRLLAFALDPSSRDAEPHVNAAGPRQPRPSGPWDAVVAAAPRRTLNRHAPARILLAKAMVR